MPKRLKDIAISKGNSKFITSKAMKPENKNERQNKMKATKYTQADLYAAEEACKFAHRKLGIRKNRNAATKTDYLDAERAGKRLEKIRTAMEA